MKKNNNKGFSLVELIVVIAIMAVLVGVLAPSLLRYVEKSRIQKDVSAVSEVREAVIVAMADEDIMTATADGTIVKITSGSEIDSGVDALDNELKTVIGDKLTFTSNAMKGKTVALKITVSGTTVKCAFDSAAVDGTTVTDTTALASLAKIE